MNTPRTYPNDRPVFPPKPDWVKHMTDDEWDKQCMLGQVAVSYDVDASGVHSDDPKLSITVTNNKSWLFADGNYDNLKNLTFVVDDVKVLKDDSLHISLSPQMVE